jgi:hypothetical protein
MKVVVGCWVLAVGCAEAPRGTGVGSGTKVTAITSAASGEAAEAADASYDGPEDGSAGAFLDGHVEAASADARRGTLVAHIGDSFAEAWFEQNLRGRFRGVGAKYWVKAETSAATTTWVYHPDFQLMMAARPALVIISLGANEFDMPTPEIHAGAVRSLAKKASVSGSCVWVAPPRWKKDTGILDVIRRNCAPCLYFDTDSIVPDIERQSWDRIHPNEKGGAKWAAAFWQWLEDHRVPEHGAWALRE